MSHYIISKLGMPLTHRLTDFSVGKMVMFIYIYKHNFKINFICCLSKLLSNQVIFYNIKSQRISSWRKIGQNVLIMIIIKTIYLCLICLAFQKLLKNDTNIPDEYHYKYHCCTFDVFNSCFSFNTRH